MPEVLDWSGAEIGKFYRPPKEIGDHAPGRGHSRMVEKFRTEVSDSRELITAARHDQHSRSSQENQASLTYTATVTEVSVRVTGR